jgi:hypothetical protein
LRRSSNGISTCNNRRLFSLRTQIHYALIPFEMPHTTAIHRRYTPSSRSSSEDTKNQTSRIPALTHSPSSPLGVFTIQRQPITAHPTRKNQHDDTRLASKFELTSTKRADTRSQASEGTARDRLEDLAIISHLSTRDDCAQPDGCLWRSLWPPKCGGSILARELVF